LVEVVVVVTAVDVDVVTVLVCDCVVVTVEVFVDVVGDFVVVSVVVCEDVLVELVEVAAVAALEVEADVVRDCDCDGVVWAAVLVRVMLPLNVPLWLLRLLLRLDAAPDPHAAQRTADVAASAAFRVIDRGTRVSRWAIEMARSGLPVDAGCGGCRRVISVSEGSPTVCSSRGPTIAFRAPPHIVSSG
jgi:hypothetical protein